MANIRVRDLPENPSPSPEYFALIDNGGTQKVAIKNFVDAGAPVATQAEAEAGTDNEKRMTPLTTKQAIEAIGAADFATSAQGDLADSALQPGDIGNSVQAHDPLLDSVSALALQAGDILYASSADTIEKLPKGTDGQLLQMGASLPAWSNVDSGGGMLPSIYDPQNVESDAFDRANFHGADPVYDPQGIEADSFETSNFTTNGNPVGATGFDLLVDSMANLMPLTPGPNGVSVKVANFYSDKDGGGGHYVWHDTYGKENHNGGTIIDPTHSVTPGETGWWTAVNTGGGCWVLIGADGDLDVRTFGGRNGEPANGTGYDSQPAFDAAFRTCFWDHKNKAAVNTPMRDILMPLTDGAQTGVGYYLGSRVTDKTSGWPLTAAGVEWTAAEVQLGTVINWRGNVTHSPKHFYRRHLHKAGNDYGFRFHWIVPGFWNMEGNGQGEPNPNNNTTETYPFILTNYVPYGDNVTIGFCGGPDYATLEPGVSSVYTGRVGYRIADGPSVPSCFAIGIICDDSEYGTNYSNDGLTSSNCNSSRITRLSAKSVYGDVVFYSASEDAFFNANAAYFQFEDIQRISGSALCINGGWRNTGHFQVTQNTEALLKCTRYGSSGHSCTFNVFTAGYSNPADGVGRQLYLDPYHDASNKDGSKLSANSLEIIEAVTVAEAIGVQGGSDSQTWGRNGVVQKIALGAFEPTLIGFGAPASFPVRETDIVVGGTATVRQSINQLLGDATGTNISGGFHVTAYIGTSGDRPRAKVEALLFYDGVGPGTLRGYVFGQEDVNAVYDIDIDITEDDDADVVFTTSGASATTAGYIVISKYGSGSVF